MRNISFQYNKNNKVIKVCFPLTCPTGNVRVRKRDSKKKYGYQVYKNEIKNNLCYIDWQIEYDTKKEEKSFSKIQFVRSVNGDIKYLYCLSDIIYFFFKSGVINKKRLLDIKNDLSIKTNNDYIISNPSIKTKQFRDFLKCQKLSLSNFDFKPFSTVFPLYLVTLAKNIDVEIGLFEGGFATSSLMPHLYVCIPFTCLENFKNINGNNSEFIKVGEYNIDKTNIDIFLNIFHLIGLLTEKHKKDIIDIINSILK